MNRLKISTSTYRNPIVLSFLILASTFAAFMYMRLLLNDSIRGDIIPYLMVIIAESYIVIQAIMVSWTFLSGDIDPRSPEFYETQFSLFSSKDYGYLKLSDLNPQLAHKMPLRVKKDEVSVDVVITVYGEDPKVVESTAKAAKKMYGKHKTVILDDGCSKAIEKMAASIGVDYIPRESSEGAKAGNINNALKQLDGDFVAIFDADHKPEPDFLYATIPYFYDEKVAFVQSPQFYKNKTNHISKGASYAQDLFYKYICPGKNKFNSAFCVGTNVVFRRTALNEVGGIYQDSKSEDIWTSLLLHEHGWRSIFTPQILAKGEAPDTIKAFLKQQQRWATGGMEILFHDNPISSKNLNINQKLQYLWTASFYLHGLATALLFFLPSLYILLGLSPINSNLEFFGWLTIYGFFYGLQIIIASYSMRGFRLETLVLSTFAFPIYLKALVNGLFLKDEKWHVTGNKESDSPFNYMVPQMVLFVLLIVVDFIGLMRFYESSEFSVALLWNLINTFVFAYVFRIGFLEIKNNRVRSS